MATKKPQIPLDARIPQAEPRFFYPKIQPRTIGDIETTTIDSIEAVKPGKERTMAPVRRKK
jgi:hypothetical protein